MLIVSGWLRVSESDVDAFVAASRDAVLQARAADGCIDFVVARDPIEADRVNVYEEWESEEQLMEFRGSGPGDAMNTQILEASVQRHQIASSGPA